MHLNRPGIPKTRLTFLESVSAGDGPPHYVQNRYEWHVAADPMFASTVVIGGGSRRAPTLG
jgi:hypothetical protein